MIAVMSGPSWRARRDADEIGDEDVRPELGERARGHVRDDEPHEEVDDEHDGDRVRPRDFDERSDVAPMPPPWAAGDAPDGNGRLADETESPLDARDLLDRRSSDVREESLWGTLPPCPRRAGADRVELDE